jgi:uncharacterized protein (DUF2126 family)/transglutaminase-like putative cysteine protease
MAIRVALTHTTQYRYDRPVNLGPQVVRLRPAAHARTPVPAYSLKIGPQPHFLNWQQDPAGNFLARLVFPKPVREFSVAVDLVAELTALNPFDYFVEASAETVPFEYAPGLARELAPYFVVSESGPRLQELAATFRVHGVQINDYIVAINRRLHELVRYVIRMEPGVQTCEETLEKASGSCRDSAWLLVQLLRHLGLAARFVSGYLIQLVADEKSLDGPSGTDRDFTDLHAWAEVYLPGAGWVGLDATSGLLCGEGHIPLACAAEPAQAAPISGALGSADPTPDGDQVQSEFHFHMAVTRIREDPRTTKPYTDEQWAAIEALGRRIDADLEAHDVRLTMGGEPTFVSLDDRNGEEWHTAAVGPHKRELAGVLLRRLRDRFAPGGLLHFGQGKWYPGESLPRWALGCWWRRDGVPVWSDPGLVAEDAKNYGVGPDHAQRFVATLAGRLGLDAAFAQPGYEDAWYYLWRERRLPGNVDPLASNLDDPEERERLARVFEQGLGKIIGFALPLRRSHAGPQPLWESGPWFLRREHLFLIPGDSSMGLRLPLDSLPWSAPDAIPAHTEEDAFEAKGPLPPRQWRFPAAPSVNGRPEEGRPFTPGQPAPDSARTALCVEPRGGHLYVFMPPQRYTADYLDLVSAIEATAADLDLPVMIEGYTPPHDPRLRSFKVTPDPGVIEVNTQPAADWDELSAITTALYEEARLSRLVTDRFQVDGRHTGTGGGNHLVLGGPTPADSPLLRRPDLLRSLVAYWHNHPSLSYLFSSLFVGPTSQAPRVDEARTDAVYELELAFEQLPERGPCPPWLVDRVFRNLLVDATGNTHRAEFCIDKLFSPDGAAGRLGLLELRAFEMPPHARMSLAQQLLLRALVARFWQEPYRQKLVRWDTELHDRFLLPHFVMQDFSDVMEQTRRAGYDLRDDWFAPHAEFRFPLVGRATHRDITIELRNAVEPWHVLGEEPAGGGTVRYVDSSVERLQVKVTGMTDPRHVLACNGRRVPLVPTGTHGEFIAGVRFRAWQPPSCLHPTVPSHAPLVFDIVDTWMERSAGGCTYHVSHPGGRSFDTFPVNALEAESRRHARFFPMGHTAGTVPVPPEERLPRFPRTLDLRQPAPPPPAVPRPASRIVAHFPPVRSQ